MTSSFLWETFCEQQLNSTPSDRSEFLFRRLDEYERTLSTLISRFCETYGHELSQQTCLADLTLILRRTSFLRSHFERQRFLLEDGVDVSRRADRRSAPTERYGLQGRPRVVVTQQQLQTLHEVCGFRWNDIAETLGVSDRTLRRRRHEFGMRVEGREFSLLSDAELDDIVRNIRAVTPEAGLLMVQGSLRQQGLMVQRVRVMHSPRRVDPVTSALRNARRIIRRSYNVPSPNSLCDDDSHSPSRGWIHELRNRKAGNSNDEVIKGSLHLDSLTEDKVRSLMSVIIEFNPDMKEVVQAYLEVCDLPEMEAKLIKLKEKVMMHINDSHVSPSGLQHAPWNCFDVPNPLAHFMKVCVIQGDNLLSEEQWEDAVYYVLMAWSHVNSIPELDTFINWAKQNCFKLLAERCRKALEMMQKSLTNEKCEDLLKRMKVAWQQNAAIQPCMDIVGEFLSQWQYSPREGHSVCACATFTCLMGISAGPP